MTWTRATLAIAAWLGAGSLVAACGTASERPADAAPASDTLPEGDTFLLVNARALDGEPLDLAVLDGTVVLAASLPDAAPRVDAGGAFVVPAFIDAHVHLSYLPVASAHAAGGIAVAIDLAAPIETLGRAESSLVILRAGPMITAPGGYPLDSWGSDGYGVECADPAACSAVVDLLVMRGAALLKVPIEPGAAGLDDASLAAIASSAHAHDRLLVAHALRDADVQRAIRAGVDVLAHTPIERLSDESVAALGDRTVISTLAAFGGGAAAVENVARLHAAGVVVLYGTDLGNTRRTGIDPEELDLLSSAGLDATAIVESATAAPARVFGLTRHGSLAPGHAASFLLFRSDPRPDPTALARPDLVVIDGLAR